MDKQVNIFDELKIFKWLFLRDIKVLYLELKSELPDIILWSFKILILFGYFMPTLGLPKDYGAFILFGTLVTVIFFRVFDVVNKIIQDIHYVGIIEYQLILPISSFFIFLKNVFIFVIRSFIISICVYFTGCILLVQNIYDTPSSMVKAFIIILLTSFMFAGLTFLIVSLTKVKNLYFSYFSTILFTLWDFGCYLYSWKVLYLKIPILSYLMLLNPITYAMEGIRAAILSDSIYMNFWLCLIILIFSFVLFSILGFKFFKRRLDCF